MSRGDAVQAVPTVEEEMAKFSGFSTSDGATITKEMPEDLNPVAGKNTTAKEDAAAVAAAALKVASPVAKQVALTDEESEAALVAAETLAGKALTTEEEAAALAAANTAKNKPAGAPPKKSFQDRINKSIRAQRTAERTAEAATARASALELRIAALERGDTKALTDDTKPETKVAAGGPDPSKFPFGELDAGYIRALSRFETLAAIADAKANEEKVQLTAAQQEAADKFDADKAVFEDKGCDEFPDFSEVVMGNLYDKTTNPGGWPLSSSLGAMLLESELGTKIAYELAGDIKLAKEIFGKTPSRQAAWFGKREAELSAGSGAKTADELAAAAAEAVAAGKKVAAVKVTKAPAPVVRARGQGSNSETPADTQDFSAFEAAYWAGQRKT